LLFGEGVKALVSIESAYHIVPIGPDRHILIAMIAHGIGIANEVQPILRHALAVVRACKVAGNEAFISVGASVRQKCGDLLRRRR
jgi:hypothetical protein